jgi:hypothetical protein
MHAVGYFDGLGEPLGGAIKLAAQSTEGARNPLKLREARGSLAWLRRHAARRCLRHAGGFDTLRSNGPRATRRTISEPGAVVRSRFVFGVAAASRNTRFQATC